MGSLGRDLAAEQLPGDAPRLIAMQRTPRIAVIGGGIGGLAAAVALHRRGIEVAVYEQSAALGEIGAGIAVSPNAVKACRALGIEAEIEAVGCAAEWQIMRNGRSGRIVSRQALGRNRANFGAPHLTLHRADFLDILARALPADRVRMGARCVAVTAGDKAAAVRFADGSEIEADIVVGADGIHSAVRASLFGAGKPRFTRCVCYRGLVPMADVAESINRRDNLLWMGPHGHIVHYPVRSGELLNVVAHIDSDAWTEESWTRRCDRTELIATYRDWHPALLELFQSSQVWYKWALYDRDPLDQWRVGRATLLGDSAHAMLPYLGQGAAMAIEDGCILAACVAGAPDDLDAALARYEMLRKPRTRQAVLGSRQRATENHLASPWARLQRDLKIAIRNRFAADKTLFRAAWLYAYDVATERGTPP
jgi:2-polyprenyl-6-methoxyphenol hydroxylase-like FAD-dependent oxidoreductase